MDYLLIYKMISVETRKNTFLVQCKKKNKSVAWVAAERFYGT